MFNAQQIQQLKVAKHLTRLKRLEIYDEYLSHDRKIDYQSLNPQQHFLFKRVLHGLKMYNEAEIAKMHWDKKRRVIKVWKRGQEVINELKQWVAYKQVQPIFRIFAKSELGRAIYESEFEYLPDYRNKHTLKDLGLNYSDLILKFMSVGLVPKNFYSLK